MTEFDMIKKIQLRFIENTGLTPFTRSPAGHSMYCKFKE
jgi:hypothetical protein